MRKVSILIACAAISASWMQAAQVSESQAQQEVVKFLKTTQSPALKSMRSATPRLAYKIERGGDAAVYAYKVQNNVNNQFVLIAGDDQVPSVLGYGNGDFDYNNLPDNARWWIDSYADQIEAIREGKATAATPKATGKSVAPLLGDIQWNQLYPYNIYTPVLDNGDHCATGCTATAMAMVMRYHKWPLQGEGSMTYTCPTGKKWELSADFSKSTYNWDLMTPQYDDNSTSEQREAVARLMSDCGIAIKSQYGESTGAYYVDVAKALTKFFKYDKGLKIATRSFYTADNWAALVRSELDQSRPVPYYGWTESYEGHSFVCDGYSDDGLFHINWGWAGKSDGYFNLALLNPSEQGTGGSSSKSGFNQQNAILTGVKKAETGSEKLAYLLSASLIKDMKMDGRTVSISNTFYNYGYDDFNGDIYMQIVNSATDKVLYEEKTASDCNLGLAADQKYFLKKSTFEFPANTEYGTYVLKYYSVDKEGRKLDVFDAYSDSIYVSDSGIKIGDVHFDIRNVNVMCESKGFGSQTLSYNFSFDIVNTGEKDFNGDLFFAFREEAGTSVKPDVSLKHGESKHYNEIMFEFGPGPMTITVSNNDTRTLLASQEIGFCDSDQELVVDGMNAEYNYATKELKLTADIRNLDMYDTFSCKLKANVCADGKTDTIASMESETEDFEVESPKTVTISKKMDLPAGDYTIGFTYESNGNTLKGVNNYGAEERAKFKVSTVGVEAIEADGFAAYQAGDKLVVNSKVSDAEVAVYAIDGKLLYSGKTANSEAAIDGSQFAQGLLIVKVNNAATKIAWK